MERTDLHAISRQRKREAAALLRAQLYGGAYYLAGYAVECALKACIAKRTRRHEFPDRNVAISAWTHDLDRLVDLAGLDAELAKDMAANPALRVNWGTVSEWKETARSDLTITPDKAKELYFACTRRNIGILSWIRRRW